MVARAIELREPAPHTSRDVRRPGASMKKIAVLLFSLVLAGCWEGETGKENSAVNDASAEIADLVNNWAFYRDQEAWSELGATFHDEGTISLSWFDGPHKGFVAASQNLAKSNRALLKHYIGVPRIRIDGDQIEAQSELQSHLTI
ncbi:MAG: nuclear transport factor 2 family protein, partial [Parvibaculum sp.]|nr:nuclear transport factor 2 family protein [Parvibaculum sp.]